MKSFYLSFLFLLLSSIILLAEDPKESSVIVCFGDLQVKTWDFGVGCDSEIEPEDLLVDGLVPGETYSIEVYADYDGFTFSNPISNPVPYEYFGETVWAVVSRSSDGNSCWTPFQFWDNLPPDAVFFSDPGNLTCQDDFEALNLAGAIDACDPEPQVELIGIEYICRDMDTDSVRLTYRATDAFNNFRDATFGAELVNFCLPFELPEDESFNCPQEIPYPPNNISIDIPDCESVIAVSYMDTPDGNCGVYREYTYFDFFLTSIITHVQHLSVNDHSPPNFIANSDTEITFTELLENTYIPYAEVYDNCGIADRYFYYELMDPDDCNRPEFMVRYYMYAIDNCGNDIVETHDVLVIRDGTPRLRINGRKDCSADFIVEAEIDNMVPPYSFSFESSNPDWPLNHFSYSSASISPGSGATIVTVTVTDGFGCEYSKSKRYNCGGRRHMTRPFNDVNIYPNPFTNIIYVENSKSFTSISVYNLMGKIVFNQPIPESDLSIKIDLPHVPQGLYLVRLENEHDHQVIKMVRE